MKPGSRKWLLSAVAAAATSGVALLAHAWQLSAPFDAVVNDHEFHELKAWNEGCVLKVKLRFKAPESSYQSRASARNYYRFKARLEMSDNITVDSPIFGNPAAGNRVYTFSRDTESGGCWAETKLKIHNIDIEGCRGRRCHVQPFE